MRERKNLSPSPFRTAETTAPPRLYAVPPTHDVDPVSVVVEQDMKKIVAPSDQELWMKEVASVGFQGSAKDFVASAPPLPSATMPSIPTLHSNYSNSVKRQGISTECFDGLPWASQGVKVLCSEIAPLREWLL